MMFALFARAVIPNLIFGIMISNESLTNLNPLTARESTESPPGSPTTYRRFNSRGENVFSRLTGGIQYVEQPVGRGIISEYSGKTNAKAPFGCAYIASGHSHAVLSVCATNTLLFTASKDRSVKVWDLTSGMEVQSMTGHPNNVEVVRYCESSKLLFSVSSAYVKVWDLRESPSRCIKTLCSSGLTINGTVSVTTQSRTLTIPQGEAQLNDVALNENGSILYTAAGDRVRVWDLRRFSSTGKLAGGHQAAVMCLAVGKLSETEDVVVTGSKDHYIKVFEVNGNSGGVFSPKMNLNPPHYDGIQSLALHSDILFSGSRDMCIKKWDLTRQELIQSINNAHSNWVCGLVLMPGGQQLVSGCRSGILKIWSVESCCLLGELKAHNSPINDVAVNSTHIFTASNDGCVRLWKSQNFRVTGEKSPIKEKTSPNYSSNMGRFSPKSAWIS